jgi:MFS transporter, Spinster family, sphingosine-1-phosphate transporter
VKETVGEGEWQEMRGEAVCRRGGGCGRRHSCFHRHSAFVIRHSVPSTSTPEPHARRALALLLAINLFNYIDRSILAAVEPTLRHDFFAAGDLSAKAKTGSLATAFLLSYMLLAPVFGWFADRMSRWVLVGISVALWTLASGWSGLAGSFVVLLITRMFVGVGEAGYGPSAPTILSDLFPVEKRGRIMSIFYLAIPVGSALGYVFGGWCAGHLGWRWAFYLVVPPGLVLAALCFFQRDPRESKPAVAVRKASIHDYLGLLKIPSYVLNTAAMTAMTFALGGIGFFMPRYLQEVGHLNPTTAIPIFGVLAAFGGLAATIAGGMAGDKLRDRFPGSYFLVAGAGMLAGFPLTLLMLVTPFPLCWVVIFAAVFCLFFNTGPSNTALANTTPPAVRATAFAVNILILHALGDAISPLVIGWVARHWGLKSGFAVVSMMMLAGGLLWLWGARYLADDTQRATEGPHGFPVIAST